jgi:hypothetical protein
MYHVPSRAYTSIRNKSFLRSRCVLKQNRYDEDYAVLRWISCDNEMRGSYRRTSSLVRTTVTRRKRFGSTAKNFFFSFITVSFIENRLSLPLLYEHVHAMLSMKFCLFGYTDRNPPTPILIQHGYYCEIIVFLPEHRVLENNAR